MTENETNNIPWYNKFGAASDRIFAVAERSDWDKRVLIKDQDIVDLLSAYDNLALRHKNFVEMASAQLSLLMGQIDDQAKTLHNKSVGKHEG